MGDVRFGAPLAEMAFLAEHMSLAHFFEGGTYRGGTATQASRIFRSVHTVERSEAMFNVAKSSLAGIGNVTLLFGDSRQHLPEFVAQHPDALYWLDAHWSGGETYGEGDECPLMEELGIIFAGNTRSAILVDDARLFAAPPPRPHRREAWPTLLDIAHALPDDWDMILREDVIYLLPAADSAAFRDYLQGKAVGSAEPREPGVLRRLLGRLWRRAQ
jgi:hypothetical protein